VDAPEVEIILENKAILTGQIFALRETSIVAWVGTNANQSFVVLPHRRILNVQTVGHSNILVGLCAGCAVGLLAGFAIGGSQEVHEDKDDWLGCRAAAERSANQTEGAALGSLVGSLVGLVVGGATSTPSRVLITPGQRDFNVLRGVARYPDSEPEYLKSISP